MSSEIFSFLIVLPLNSCSLELQPITTKNNVNIGNSLLIEHGLHFYVGDKIICHSQIILSKGFNFF